jgi:hypothetical protein
VEAEVVDEADKVEVVVGEEITSGCSGKGNMARVTSRRWRLEGVRRGRRIEWFKVINRKSVSGGGQL